MRWQDEDINKFRLAIELCNNMCIVRGFWQCHENGHETVSELIFTANEAEHWDDFIGSFGSVSVSVSLYSLPLRFFGRIELRRVWFGHVILLNFFLSIFDQI